MHPARVPLRGQLLPSEVESDRKVLSDRTVVEIFFGRMTSLWKVMSSKDRWNEGLYDQFFRIRLALKNCHVKNNPLTKADTVHFLGVCSRLCCFSNKQLERRKTAQERSTQLRRECMSGDVRERLFEESDSE